VIALAAAGMILLVQALGDQVHLRQQGSAPGAVVHSGAIRVFSILHLAAGDQKARAGSLPLVSLSNGPLALFDNPGRIGQSSKSLREQLQ